MHELTLLRDGVIILLASILAVYVFHRIKAGPVLGYLAAGIAIGPHAFGLISHMDSIQALSELGVVFLLFVVGLELSFRRLMSLRTEVFGLGTAQLVLTGTAVTIGLYALGLDRNAAVVVGFGVALSSTAVVLQILAERGESAGRLGRSVFAILLLQDLAIIPLLAIVPFLGDGVGGSSTDWRALMVAIAKAAGALLAIVLFGRYLLSPLFRAIAGIGRHELFVAITLVVVLGTAYATDAVGLSLTLGAFLAGLMLAETEFRHQVEVDIKPFEGLLLGLFFVTIGMTIELRFAIEQWWRVLALLAGLIAIKTAVITGLGLLLKLPLGLALRAGLLLAQASEFAFVLVAIGGKENIISPEAKQFTLAVASLSMAATPLLDLLGRKLAARLERQTAIGLAALEQENIDLRDHVVIAGFGRFGQMIGHLLQANQIPYVALDMSAARVGEFKKQGVPIHFGDTKRPEILWGVGIDRARAIVLAHGEDPAGTLRTVKHLRIQLPELKIMVRARDAEQAAALRNAGADDAVPDALASSLHLARSVMRRFDLPEADIDQLMAQYGDRTSA